MKGANRDNDDTVRNDETVRKVLQRRLPSTLEEGTAIHYVEAKSRVRFDSSFGERYRAVGVLGRGGMGEVHLSVDSRIGRMVAMKSLHNDTGMVDAEGRFLREACVQGQLEHPSVAPVYELGVMPDGKMFFTMRRIEGVTLKEVLRQLRTGDAAVREKYPRSKLLAIFISVCHSIEFAHQRGVIHRDLKPANIMLGDFGEVYVLDWGVAKLVTESPVAEQQTMTAQTMDGEILGTAGYMAPEQVRGHPVDITNRTDVYALGAILFEILTLEPLHNRDTVHGAYASTLGGADARASVRAPHMGIEPELDAICVRATDLNPENRHENVRDIREAIDRHQSGSRDLELRKKLAAEHAEVAKKLVQRLLFEGEENPEEEALRADAMTQIGKALALDPDNVLALEAMVQIVSVPPKHLPEGIRDRLTADGRRMEQLLVQNGRFGLVAMLCGLAVIWSMGVRDMLSAALVVLPVSMMLILNVYASVTKRPGSFDRRVSFFSGIVLCFLLTRAFGPLVMTPALAAVFVQAFVMPETPKMRVAMIMSGVAVIALPVATWLTGIAAPPYIFTDEMLCLVPQAVSFSPAQTILALVASGVIAVMVPAVTTIRVADARAEAEKSLLVQTWHFEQMVRRAKRGLATTSD